jgi:hypothetical protein
VTGIRVYVNERPVDVPAGTDAGGAVRALDPALGAAVAEGAAYLTDGRGIRLAADTRLAAGSILRVIRPARRAPGASEGPPEADADA